MTPQEKAWEYWDNQRDKNLDLPPDRKEIETMLDVAVREAKKEYQNKVIACLIDLQEEATSKYSTKEERLIYAQVYDMVIKHLGEETKTEINKY